MYLFSFFLSYFPFFILVLLSIFFFCSNDFAFLFYFIISFFDRIFLRVFLSIFLFSSFSFLFIFAHFVVFFLLFPFFNDFLLRFTLPNIIDILHIISIHCIIYHICFVIILFFCLHNSFLHWIDSKKGSHEIIVLPLVDLFTFRLFIATHFHLFYNFYIIPQFPPPTYIKFIFNGELDFDRASPRMFNLYHKCRFIFLLSEPCPHR